MKYLLKYKNKRIGVVEGTDEDFLNLWGEFKATEINDEFILDYIRLSKKESDLIEDEHLRDISEGLEQIEKNKSYIEMIESKDWVLEGEDQKNHNILSPSFKSDGSIVWRWRL